MSHKISNFITAGLIYTLAFGIEHAMRKAMLKFVLSTSRRARRADVLHRAGYTYEEIGKKLGISRQRAHQLVNGHCG